MQSKIFAWKASCLYIAAPRGASLFNQTKFIFLASSAWALFWAWLILPVAEIRDDAAGYVAMVLGPMNEAPVPFCFRVAVPFLARLLPFSPEHSLHVITVASISISGTFWFVMGKRLGYSSRSLMFSACAVCSTQGWTGYFSNPYLTDGGGLLAVMSLWSVWVTDWFWVALVLFSFAPLIRETSAPLSLLWLSGRRWQKGAAAIAVCVLSLAVVHLWPNMPASDRVPDTIASVLNNKGPVRIIGDVFASYHGLWLAGLLGWTRVPEQRRRYVGPALLVTLLAAAGLSFLAINTVRMFTLALPFMAYLFAEFFQSVRNGAWVAAACLTTSTVWFPTRLLGDAISNHKAFQYLLSSAVLLLVILVWRNHPSPVGEDKGGGPGGIHD